jgi:predicted transcriptional regulator
LTLLSKGGIFLPEDKMKIKDLHIKVTKELAEKVSAVAKKQRRKISEVLTIAVEQYINKRKF